MQRQYGALSGLAIVLIVLNHAVHFGTTVAPASGHVRDLLIALQALGGFAVPMFLFISGAFLSYAAAGLSLTFLRSSLERLLWPYLIWSIVFYALVFAATGAREPLSSYAKHLLVGYPYHFVPLLVFWYLASPLVVPLARRHGVWLLTVVGLYQGLLLSARFADVLGTGSIAPEWLQMLHPPVLFTSLAQWALYFPLGLVLSLHDRRMRQRLVALRPLAIGVTLLLFAVGLLNAYGLISAPWARFLAPMPLMFALPTIGRDAIPLRRALEAVGRRSYGLYLSHFIAINAAVLALSFSDMGVFRIPLFTVPLLFAVGLGVPLALMELLARARAARRAYRFVFGIVPRPA